MPSDTHVDAITFDDVDSIYVPSDDQREGELIQLDRGPMGLRGRLWRLPEIHIYRWEYGAALFGREIRHDGAISAFLRLDQGARSKVNGRELPNRTIGMRLPDSEVEFVSPRNCRVLGFDIGADLVAQFGWRDHAEGAIEAAPQAIERLKLEAARIVSVLERSPHLSAEMLRLLQHGLLPYLDACLGLKAASSFPTREGELVALATKHLRGRPTAEKLSVVGLASELGVSERRLYQAFKTWVGVGPYELDMLHRLHRFRETIARGPTSRGCLGRAARRLGFKDRSRLGVMYRRHFDESPSETLRRRRRSVD